METRIRTGRDPFARHTIRKRKVSGNCSWCGCSKNGKVWKYYVDADSERESGEIKGAFCGVSCLNIYHNP